MAKNKVKTFFLCRNCGSMHAKWMGKCPDCGTWDSLEETAKATEDPHRPRALTMGRIAGEEGRGGGEGGTVLKERREGAVGRSRHAGMLNWGRRRCRLRLPMCRHYWCRGF